MKTIRFIIFLSFFCATFFFSNIYAQELETKQDVQQRIENAAENAENDEIDYTILLEDLQYYLTHPINLNNAEREELSKLELLSDIQINALLKHIDRHGKLMAIYELQCIDGFDANTIFRILPYVKINNSIDESRISWNEIFENGKFQYVSRYQQILEQQIGYKNAMEMTDSAKLASPNNYYLGKQFKLYQRFNFIYSNKINAGIVAEKDPGEAFFKGTQKQWFDFYSAHIFLKKFGKLKSLALGDFQAQFGQGLTFWSGLAYGKTSDPMLVKRSARGLSAYNSVDENLFLRGGGFTIAHKNFEFTTFGSTKKIDASVSLLDTLNVNAEEFSSFQTSGLHRTNSEIKNKDAVKEIIYGGNLSYIRRSLSLGITAVRTEYQSTLNRNLGIYNRFEFNQNHNLNLGLDYACLWRNINLFGEFARSENGGMALLSGALINLDQRFSLSAVYRNYQRDFQPVKARAFGENYTSSNEKGLFLGATAKILPKITLSAYFDQFAFPWLKYQVYAPSRGTDFLSQINYTPSKTIDIYFRVRVKSKQVNTPEVVNFIDYLVTTERSNYRFNIVYSASAELKLANRIEWVRYKEGYASERNGYLIFQDVKYKPLGYRFSIGLRYMLFQTESYDARLYAYENDVLYSNTIPFFSGKGSRFYALLNYDIAKNIELWVRYAQTYYTNPNVFLTTSSESMETVIGNKKSDIKVQLRMAF